MIYIYPKGIKGQLVLKYCPFKTHICKIHLVEVLKNSYNNMDVLLFQLVQQLRRLLENDGLFNILLLLILLGVAVHTFLFRKSHRFPPGPFSWPIVGNLLILGKSPQIKLANLAKQYGPLMYLQLGSVNTLVASSPAMAKEFPKKPRWCVPISSTFTSSKNCGQQLDFWNNFWFHLAIC